MTTIKDKLIEAGVKNLKDYGYPAVDKENILTDIIYSGFFLSMLRENLGQGIDAPINELIEEINKNESTE